MAEAQLRDQHGNPVPLTDQYGNPVILTDERGNPVQLTGVATTATGTAGSGFGSYGTGAYGGGASATTVADLLATQPRSGREARELRRSSSSSSSSVFSLSFSLIYTCFIACSNFHLDQNSFYLALTSFEYFIT